MEKQTQEGMKGGRKEDEGRKESLNGKQ